MAKCWHLTLAIISITTYTARTPHRGLKEQVPSITVSSSDNPATIYRLTDTNLRPTPLLYIFDREHLSKRQLPTPTIPGAFGATDTNTADLNTRIHELLQEIDHKNKHYTHFTILKDSGFVRHKKCGLLIVKFNEYPFVLKLFIEPAKSFTNPYDKGFEAANIFVMSGAIRHTLGFTRIKTLDYVRNKIDQDPYWHDKMIVPRKWFWLPEHPVWLTITTHNLGTHTIDTVHLPSVYGIIADALQKDAHAALDYDKIMAFSKFLEHRIDPNTHNFFIEKTTGKMALIDTELFPVIAGFKKPIKPHSTHAKWYTYLAGHYLQKKIFSHKELRTKQLTSLDNYYLTTKT